MNSFPANFSSLKEYTSYFGCLNALRPGDKITFPDRLGGLHEGIFIAKELRQGSRFAYWQILVGSNLMGATFHRSSIQERRVYLAPAKKICPTIRISTTNLCWLDTLVRITKIVKYHGEKEKEEKKAGDKKPVRARRKNA